MKQIIKRVLEEISTSQVNLTSASARTVLAEKIESALKVSGEYKKMTEEEFNKFKARETWVCEVCGKNTYNVDWDYIGTGTNHLGCDLEVGFHSVLEMKSKSTGDDVAKALGHMDEDGEYITDKVFGHDQGGSYEKIESLKLVEEISSGSIDLGYIFESPDGGTTVYKRQVGESERELVTKEDWKQYNRNR